MSALSAIGRGVKSFGLFWWEFIVGEDATIALAVAIGLAVVFAVDHSGTPGWWALGLFWVLALVGSLLRVALKARSSS